MHVGEGKIRDSKWGEGMWMRGDETETEEAEGELKGASGRAT